LLSIGRGFAAFLRETGPTLTPLSCAPGKSPIANNVRLRECPPPIAGAFDPDRRTFS